MDMRIKIENSEFGKDELPKRINSENSNPDLKILAFNIGHLNQTLQFLICCAGVFVFYLVYGYLQELIFTLEGFKPFGWYLTLVQFAYYSVFGYVEMTLRRISGRKIPLKTYLVLALLTLGTMGFSNSSLGYLNYPTQVIFKCCKLIPVLIGGILIQKKSYGLLDFLAAGSMCVGLTLFTLADSQMSPNFNTLGLNGLRHHYRNRLDQWPMPQIWAPKLYLLAPQSQKKEQRFVASSANALGSTCSGVVSLDISIPVTGVMMISCALLCDAVIGNLQEKSMKTYKATNTEVVLYSYSIGFVYLFVIMLVSGDLVKGILFCSKHPKETYGYGLLFSLSGYLGIQIVLTLVRTCGALAAATVTTCRKAVTIVISFIFFSKPFTFQYVWSGLIVVLGIYLNIYSKNQGKTSLKNCCAKLNQVPKWALSRVQHKSYPTDKRLLADV
uniref:Adenosine 3'-phospho 5'-phosphosulfate transporter 2 n=1 Tax=Timema poppense TaxID=170557 RepID=A0A7R9D690_TIMPO|nr:unnamed protein product [Timema poppensis]